ncbi:MAG: hypothetical protein ACE5GW_05610 [Planctomycetota bacterium]
MEEGILIRPEVEELLRRHELFEVFTDGGEEEEQYRRLQKQITGYNANPTYIILSSDDLLEVARSAYTNSGSDFIGFLKKGLTNRPAFRSWIRFTGLEIKIGEERITVLEPDGLLESDPGEPVIYRGEAAHAYRGAFRARQAFRVAKGLGPGEYVLRAQLVTGIYDGDERRETISVPVRLPFEVLR